MTSVRTATSSAHLRGQRAEGSSQQVGGAGLTVRASRLLLLAGALAAAAPSAAEARDRPALIVIYHGFGTEARARVWGRVLEDDGAGPARAGESRWRKIRRTLNEMESDEIAGARVTVKLLGKSYPVQANREGLFQVDLPGPLPTGTHEVDARMERKGGFRTRAGRLLVYPKRPGQAVISDIDDTVLQTGVGDKAALLKKVLTSNAHDLKTYPHAPALYQVWAQRRYPLIFVSGSPINLYTRLSEFMALRGFPTAPLLLKNLGKGNDSLFEQRAYKLRRIREVQELLPGYRLLLIGDSGEKDPEIYGEVRRASPQAVAETMIHLVSKESAGSTRFHKGLVFDSYLQLARTLARRRQLSPAELKSIEAARP